MTDTRRIALELSEETMEDLREALSAEVAKRQRAATRAASELDNGGGDKRSGAMAIMRSLASTDRLAKVAEALAVEWVREGGDVPPTMAAAIPDTPEPLEEAPAPRRKMLDALVAELRKVNGDEDPDGATVVDLQSRRPASADIDAALAAMQDPPTAGE